MNTQGPSFSLLSPTTVSSGLDPPNGSWFFSRLHNAWVQEKSWPNCSDFVWNPHKDCSQLPFLFSWILHFFLASLKHFFISLTGSRGDLHVIMLGPLCLMYFSFNLSSLISWFYRWNSTVCSPLPLPSLPKLVANFLLNSFCYTVV